MRALAAAAALGSAAAVVIPVPLTCNPTCTGAINAAIASCPAAGPCTVALAPGTYTLDGPAYSRRLSANGLSNFALLGAGAGAGGTQLLLTDIGNTISVSGGANVTLSGFSVDMQRVPFTYGQMVAVDTAAGTAVVSFDSSASGLYPIDLARYPWLGQVTGILSYDAVKQRVAPTGGTDIYALPPHQLNASYSGALGSTNMTIQAGAQSHGCRVGDWVVVRHATYSYDFADISLVEGFTLSGVTVYAQGGMGLLTNSVAGPIVVDNFRIAKAYDAHLGAPRPMSICADGMHFSNVRGGGVVITNSLFEGQGDDGMNIPTIFEEIVYIGGTPAAPQIRVMGRGSTGPSAPPGNAAVGQPIKFWSRQMMQLLGTATIASIGSNATITLAGPLPAGVALYGLVTAADGEASYVELVNNTFRNNRARGALLKSSNVYAANNTFDGVSGPAVKTETDGCYWFEGHPVTNWTFVNNVVTECNFGTAQMGGDVIIDSSVPVFVNGAPTTQCVQPTSATPAVQHQLNISGNVITQISGQAAIAVYSTQGLTLVGNSVTVEAGAPVPKVNLLGAGVTADVVSGNVCNGGACTTQGL